MALTEREAALNQYRVDCVLLGLDEDSIESALVGFAAGWDQGSARKVGITSEEVKIYLNSRIDSTEEVFTKNDALLGQGMIDPLMVEGVRQNQAMCAQEIITLRTVLEDINTFEEGRL